MKIYAKLDCGAKENKILTTDLFLNEQQIANIKNKIILSLFMEENNESICILYESLGDIRNILHSLLAKKNVLINERWELFHNEFSFIDIKETLNYRVEVTYDINYHYINELKKTSDDYIIELQKDNAFKQFAIFNKQNFLNAIYEFLKTVLIFQQNNFRENESLYLRQLKELNSLYNGQ